MATFTPEPQPEPLKTEPWLRGPLEAVHPLVMPVFFSFALVREDLSKHTAGLVAEAVWRLIGGASLGFHLKHIAGSIDRLTTYLEGNRLDDGQFAALASESKPDLDLSQLLEAVNSAIAKSETALRQVDPSTIYDRRSVGTKELPTTVLGLLVHIAEHTQRHLGQAVTLCKLLR